VRRNKPVGGAFPPKPLKNMSNSAPPGSGRSDAARARTGTASSFAGAQNRDYRIEKYA
jgi:hypothetical protein